MKSIISIRKDIVNILPNFLGEIVRIKDEQGVNDLEEFSFNDRTKALLIELINSTINDSKYSGLMADIMIEEYNEYLHIHYYEEIIREIVPDSLQFAEYENLLINLIDNRYYFVNNKCQQKQNSNIDLFYFFKIANRISSAAVDYLAYRADPIVNNYYEFYTNIAHIIKLSDIFNDFPLLHKPLDIKFKPFETYKQISNIIDKSTIRYYNFNLNEKWYITWGNNVFCQLSERIEYYERILDDLFNAEYLKNQEINRLKDIIAVNKLKLESSSSNNNFNEIAITLNRSELKLQVPQNVLAALIIKYRNLLPSHLESNAQIANYFYQSIIKQHNSKPTKPSSLSKNIEQIQNQYRKYDNELIFSLKDQFESLINHIKKIPSDGTI